MSLHWRHSSNFFGIVAIIALLWIQYALEPIHAQSLSGESKVAKLGKLFVAAQEACRNEQYRRSIELCTRIIHMAPQHVNAWLFRGISYEMLGKKYKAIQDYNKAITIDPLNYQAMEGLAGILEKESKDVDRAVALYELALELDPRPEWRTKLSVWISALKSRYRYIDDNAIIAWQVGNDYLKDGDTDVAELCYSKAIKLRPTFHQAYFSRGKIRMTEGYFTDALVDYTFGLQLSPLYPRGFILRGEAWEKTGHVDEAMKDFLQARETDPYDPAAHYSIGRMYLRRGLPELALFNLNKALELKPKPELRSLIAKELQQARSAMGGKGRGVLMFLGKRVKMW